MESFLIKAAQLILALSLLVIIHELGHFLWARCFKIRVEKFYLFFNPWFSLAKWKPKGSQTEYGIGWLPLGGYVKIAGMVDESMDTEQMAQPAKPDEFRAKPAWQRLLVMTGGVLNNFILALIIYAGIAFYWGDRTIPYTSAYEGMDFAPQALAMGFRNGDIILAADGEPIDQTDRTHLYKLLESKTVTVLRGHKDTVDIAMPADAVTRLDPEQGFMAFRIPVVVKKVMNGSAAAEAGILPGDRLIGVDSLATPAFSEFSPALLARGGQTVDLKVIRGNDTISVKATPTETGKLGFELTPPMDLFEYQTKEYGFFESIPLGISNGTNTLVTYVGSLKHLFSKEGAESLGGFGAIGSMFPERWNWRTFWELTAFLSIILAFMNIIPIPALDGGHVMFLLWEVVTRKPVSQKLLERAQVAGMLFLLVLLLYANSNDIYRFLIK
ncbi:MAG: RIP metalloprotease RseP [Muribaculaceae bacterium]|nr:RIP metalloprotease RseP [Muribaculaceae bacterium]